MFAFPLAIIIDAQLEFFFTEAQPPRYADTRGKHVLCCVLFFLLEILQSAQRHFFETAFCFLPRNNDVSSAPLA